MSLSAHHSWRTSAAWIAALAFCGLAWWLLLSRPLVLCGLSLATNTVLVLCHLLPPPGAGCAFYRVPEVPNVPKAPEMPPAITQSGTVLLLPMGGPKVWTKCRELRRHGAEYRARFVILDPLTKEAQ